MKEKITLKRIVASFVAGLLWGVFLFQDISKGDSGYEYEGTGILFVSIGFCCLFFVPIIISSSFQIEIYKLILAGVAAYLIIGLVAISEMRHRWGGSDRITFMPNV
ncbi:TPA: hypothetical protein DCZ46_04180 [Candidatus Campbellbacteria bacterium]|jgi:hypothetical protein|nr:MAG: protein of unknown function with transmembrane region [Candidatus Campbellbacteria bacterium GW2011_OD1_34_28]KKP75035.1 MAG: hypothetical protein UR74_C0002G0301 [Candidatus Campbellbacteria bacterium GW2011_GWD2_35_24]KKP75921.1 MAG: hypothetical protein UR75_C0002G0302 [Candidatus Campbellbacteria bacterium GW2011_GWC2_35_28]KKP76831.1 MAG: hypothetical protein UR76_C0002G0032 [Candidatus Campbellbacteria bacterium GW2011_GWC1_35_31]KKP78757.1 MAG: hypothetical protein UR79_C0002G003